MRHEEHNIEAQFLIVNADNSVNNSSQPQSSRLRDALQWLKETKDLAYEGLNSYTATQILGWWTVIGFGAVAASEDDTPHSIAYNVTGVASVAFTAIGGTYALLRAEANRLRLSARTIRTEAAVNTITSAVAAPIAIQQELERTKDQLTVARQAAMETLQLQEVLTQLKEENAQLKAKKN